jgi:hypothetical protein
MSGSGDALTRLKRKDTLHVERDGKEIRVFNWGNLQIHRQVRVGESRRNSVFVNAGDGTRKPDAVTVWFADELAREHNVDVTQHDIEVIDPTSDEVTVL